MVAMSSEKPTLFCLEADELFYVVTIFYYGPLDSSRELGFMLMDQSLTVSSWHLMHFAVVHLALLHVQNLFLPLSGKGSASCSP